MTTIADTGPIIALAKVGQLPLLESLLGPITIPKAVYKELMARVGEEGEAIDEGLRNFIRVVEIPEEPLKKIQQSVQYLGRGEQEAILLAYHYLYSSLLIIDDKAGRNTAKNLKIPITGMVGVIIMAKNKGLIPHAGQLLMTIRERGYWLSDRIIQEALKRTGEK